MSVKQFERRFREIHHIRLFGDCHRNIWKCLDLTQSILVDPSLFALRITVFIGEMPEGISDTNFGDIVEWRSFQDNMEYTTFNLTPFHGHTTVAKQTTRGLIIHDFNLLPYDVALRGLLIDDYLHLVIHKEDTVYTFDCSKVTINFGDMHLECLASRRIRGGTTRLENGEKLFKPWSYFLDRSKV